tara:strand:+ start:1721 stop:2092 length:372 start_codon:yes stop_codon:yes gene_type:complete
MIDHGEMWEHLVAFLVDGKVSPKGKPGYDVISWQGIKLEVKHARRHKRGHWVVGGMEGKVDTLIFCLNRGATKLERIYFLPRGAPRLNKVHIPQGVRPSKGKAFWDQFQIKMHDVVDMFGRIT